jgi:hypothetical protein
VARVTFGSKFGQVRKITVKDRPKSTKSAEEVVRGIKEEKRKDPGEDYRERSLAIHGQVCARCGRDFSELQRHLLTVHHKDGNHYNNPPDGSNWENLCIYCHEDVHSRGLLGDYLQGTTGGHESSLVYTGSRDSENPVAGSGSLGEMLKKAMEKKVK